MNAPAVLPARYQGQTDPVRARSSPRFAPHAAGRRLLLNAAPRCAPAAMSWERSSPPPRASTRCVMSPEAIQGRTCHPSPSTAAPATPLFRMRDFGGSNQRQPGRPRLGAAHQHSHRGEARRGGFRTAQPKQNSQVKRKFPRAALPMRNGAGLSVGKNPRLRLFSESQCLR